MLLSSFLACIAAFISTTQAVDETECHLPLDVMFLQDTTGSFDDDLPNVVKQIPQMLVDIAKANPNSRFGVAEFHDKPFYPLGIETDFCYKLGGGLTNNTADFKWAYSGLYASGGSDLPEASYHALINVLEDAAVGWRPLATKRGTAMDPTAVGARVVILSTDAVPHLPNDYINLYDHNTYTLLPPFLTPYSGSPHPLEGRPIDWQCSAQDYPSPDQLSAIIAKHHAYLVILTPNDPAITGAWKWVNEDLLKQPAEFYQYIEADSSNILESVLQALQAVTETACATTTVEPTTSTLITSAPQFRTVAPRTSTAPQTSRSTVQTSVATSKETTVTASITPSSPIPSVPTRDVAADMTSVSVLLSSPSAGPSSATTATESSLPSSAELPTEPVTPASALASDADDCCPHVEIKLMKAPKQWKMLVVN